MPAPHQDHIASASKWSAHRLAGQRLMIGFDGTELDATHINHLKQQKIQFITRAKQAPLPPEGVEEVRRALTASGAL